MNDLRTRGLALLLVLPLALGAACSGDDGGGSSTASTAPAARAASEDGGPVDPADAGDDASPPTDAGATSGESATTLPPPPTVAPNEGASRYAALAVRDEFPDQARLITPEQLTVALRDMCQTAVVALHGGAAPEDAAGTVIDQLRSTPETAEVVPLLVAAFDIYQRALGCEEIVVTGTDLQRHLEAALAATG